MQKIINEDEKKQMDMQDLRNKKSDSMLMASS